ncbi:ATP-binding protein [soil metagenome]
MERIRRQIEATFKKRLGKNKVLLLYGTRRVGKTMLLHTIGKQFGGDYLMLNAEDLEVQGLLARRTAENYKRLIGNHALLMIDEAQVIPEIGQHLKFMIDTFPHLTIIATGSSSFDLMNQSGEPLTGRSYQYTLYPISFGELEENQGFLNASQQIEDRLVFGSYPEVITLETDEEREAYLKELVQSYLLKDIFMYETIKNSSKIFDLLKLLAYQVGSEVSLDELGRNLGMSKNTVDRYLDLLTKVFIIFRVGGYSSNLSKEVVKSSKWYFFDNGIRNAIISDFRDISVRTDVGQLWENYCFYERIKLKRYQGKATEYYFWRTYDRQEIDMIEKENTQLRAFEFKWKTDKPTHAPKAFHDNYADAPFEVVSRATFTDFVD